MHTFVDKLLLLSDVSYIFVGDFSIIGMQAWYPGIMMGQQADAKYDWGLLVVLIAVELDKQQFANLGGNSVPARVQLPLVLERCRAVTHMNLKQLVGTFINKAGWS